jgi:hypothetical protein
MQPFSCHLLEQHISKRNYESTAVQEIHISELEPQKGPLKLIFPFLSIYLGLRYEKLTFFWKHLLPINTYFRGTVIYVQYVICI